MKLKTLKDLNCDCSNQFCDLIPVDKLRQEAIKHIKELTKEGYNRTPNITITGKTGEVMKGLVTSESSMVADWIKWFFNITEDDLK